MAQITHDGVWFTVTIDCGSTTLMETQNMQVAIDAAVYFNSNYGRR